MFTIRVMTMDDYDVVIDLMTGTPGVSLRDADSSGSTARYLARNPGMSFVALIDGVICGCIMSGHDGRRGYLQHLVVVAECRRQGIGKLLVERCLSELESHAIHKFHLDVFKTNESAASYWQSLGWQLRSDIDRYSFTRSESENP
jgi:Acetyltransferases